MKILVVSFIATFYFMNMVSCQSSSNDVRFPEGTIFKSSQNQISFTLPRGYEIIVPSGNSYKISNSGSYKCECTNGDGLCKPSSAGGTVGCYTEQDSPCKECKGTVQSAVLESSSSNVYFKKPVTGGMTFPNFSKIQPVENFDDWLNTDWISQSGFEQIKHEVEEIYNDFKVNDNEELYGILAISNQGKFIIELPMRALSGGSIYSGTGPVDGGKYSCTGCAGSCKLKRGALGKIKYCDGCDSGCTLHWN